MAEKGQPRINRTKSNFVKRQEERDFVVENSRGASSYSALQTTDANLDFFNADRVPTFFPAKNQTETEKEFRPAKAILWSKRKSGPRSRPFSGESKPVYSDVVVRRNRSASSCDSYHIHPTNNGNEETTKPFIKDDTNPKDAAKTTQKGNSNRVHERPVRPNRGKNSYADDVKIKSKKAAFSNAADEEGEMKMANPKRKSRKEKSLSGDGRNPNRKFPVSNSETNSTSKIKLPKDNKDQVKETEDSKSKEDENKTKLKPKWNGNFSKDYSTRTGRYAYGARNSNVKASGPAVENAASARKPNVITTRTSTIKTESFQRREPEKSESVVSKAGEIEGLTPRIDCTMSLVDLDAVRNKHAGCCSECFIARAKSADNVRDMSQDQPTTFETLRSSIITSSIDEDEQLEGLKNSLSFIDDAMTALQVMQKLIQNVGSTKSFLQKFYDSLGKTRDVARARCRQSAMSSSSEEIVEEIIEDSWSDVTRDDEEDVDDVSSNEQVKTGKNLSNRIDGRTSADESHGHYQSRFAKH